MFVISLFYSSSPNLNNLSFLLDDAPSNANATTPPPPGLVTVVLTYDRPQSLHRALQSLERSYYPATSANQNLILKISIDVPKFDSNPWNDKQILQTRVKNRKCFDVAERFEWTHGSKQVHLRAQNAGLATQWFESWTPSLEDDKNDDYYVHIVEDDLEVSPYYYKFLWDIESHLQVLRDSTIATVCLSSVGGPGNPLITQFPVKGRELTFTCSWGAIWKASELRKFQSWLVDNYGKIKPYTSGEFNKWIDEGRDLQSVWTARYLLDSKKKFLTFNLRRHPDGRRDNTDLVVNHIEPGMNYERKGPGQNPKRLITKLHPNRQRLSKIWRQSDNWPNLIKNIWAGNTEGTGQPTAKTSLFSDDEWRIAEQQLRDQRRNEERQQ